MTKAERRTTRPSKQAEVLAAVRSAAPEGKCVDEIADDVGCAHITVRRHVAALQAQGLIYRVRHDGPRARRPDGLRRVGNPYYEYRAHS